jgi:hypothetical protein
MATQFDQHMNTKSAKVKFIDYEYIIDIDISGEEIFKWAKDFFDEAPRTHDIKYHSIELHSINITNIQFKQPEVFLSKAIKHIKAFLSETK